MNNAEAINALLHHKEAFELSGKTAESIDLAISALKKQSVDKCCETCRHKYGSQQEPPCCDCYLATAYEDCYEAEEES